MNMAAAKINQIHREFDISLERGVQASGDFLCSNECPTPFSNGYKNQDWRGVSHIFAGYVSSATLENAIGGKSPRRTRYSKNAPGWAFEGFDPAAWLEALAVQHKDVTPSDSCRSPWVLPGMREMKQTSGDEKRK